MTVLVHAGLLAVVSSASASLGAQQVAAPASVQSSATASVSAPARPPKPAEVVSGTGPAGATMRCRDGSYPAASAPDNACDSRGGILVRFALRRVPERAPSLPRAAAPAITQPPREPTADAALRAPAPSAAVQAMPANATLLCVDGTFIVSDTASVRCAGKGGVSIVFPVIRRP